MPDEIDLAQEREHIATNPFKTSVGYLVTADDRAHAARTFDLEECRRLHLDHQYASRRPWRRRTPVHQG